MKNIIEHMLGLYPMSEEAIGKITVCFKQHMFKPKDILIQAGKLDRNVYFIEKGITRSYIIHDGKEVTTWFSVEGDATCGSMDLYRNKPGFEFVEALEQTLAYSITIEELNKLYATNIDIANWMRVLQQENFLCIQETHIDRLNLSVKERYLKFIKRYPGLKNRINLGYIASYLGTTLPSLSRIRAEI